MCTFVVIHSADMHDGCQSATCRADEVICTEDEDVVERVAAITDKRGAYAAFDAVGGETLEKVWCNPAQSRVPHRQGLSEMLLSGSTTPAKRHPLGAAGLLPGRRSAAAVRGQPPHATCPHRECRLARTPPWKQLDRKR